MSEESPSPARLLHSVRRVLNTVLAAVENRVELFGVELQQEKLRLVSLLVTAAIVLALAFVGLAVLSVGLVLFVPEGWRPHATVALGLLYLATGFGLMLGVRRSLKRGPQPFSETLTQLKKDRECLKPQK